MKIFNSKILLFGEYSIMNGSKALAIPFNKFGGKLVVPKSASIIKPEQKESNSVLVQLYNYIKELNFYATPNFCTYESDLQRVLYFDSNIPQGLGLGSSGALTAAIYHEYFNHIPGNIELLIGDLASIESFFHGNSSGTDPLVSYLDKPILMNPKPEIIDFKLPKNLALYLIDTEKKRKTKRLMELYQNKAINSPDKVTELIEKTNLTIQSILTSSSNLFKNIHDLSNLQQDFLKEMFVLPGFLNVKNGKVDNELTLKLCGAGGGGFLLGFVKDASFNGIKYGYRY